METFSRVRSGLPTSYPHTHNSYFTRNGDSSSRQEHTQACAEQSFMCSWLRKTLLIINPIAIRETSCCSHFIQRFILKQNGGMRLSQIETLRPHPIGFLHLLFHCKARLELGNSSKALNKTFNFIFYIAYTEPASLRQTLSSRKWQSPNN